MKEIGFVILRKSSDPHIRLQPTVSQPLPKALISSFPLELRGEDCRLWNNPSCRDHSPDVHESETSDVRAVAVVEQAVDLLPGELQLRQLEQDAEARRNDA